MAVWSGSEAPTTPGSVCFGCPMQNGRSQRCASACLHRTAWKTFAPTRNLGEKYYNLFTDMICCWCGINTCAWMYTALFLELHGQGAGSTVTRLTHRMGSSLSCKIFSPPPYCKHYLPSKSLMCCRCDKQ